MYLVKTPAPLSVRLLTFSKVGVLSTQNGPFFCYHKKGSPLWYRLLTFSNMIKRPLCETPALCAFKKESHSEAFCSLLKKWIFCTIVVLFFYEHEKRSLTQMRFDHFFKSEQTVPEWWSLFMLTNKETIPSLRFAYFFKSEQTDWEWYTFWTGLIRWLFVFATPPMRFAHFMLKSLKTYRFSIILVLFESEIVTPPMYYLHFCLNLIKTYMFLLVFFLWM